jgi:hypothetical protein
VASIEKAETSSVPEFATYRNFPEVWATIAFGWFPAVVNGEPEIAVRAPEVVLTVNADTVPPSFAEYKNFPETVTKAAGPNAVALVPVETALPTVVNAPVVALSVKTDIDPAVAFWKFATKANFEAGVVVLDRGVKKSLHPAIAISSESSPMLLVSLRILCLMFWKPA